MKILLVSVLFLSISLQLINGGSTRNRQLSCPAIEVFLPERTCPAIRNTLYILYDVNPVEGFNLRRDVFIRMAVFVKNLKRAKIFKNAKLVLPPFPRLYHWKSSHIEQNQLFWNQFFDLDSLKRFTPAVIDFWEFQDEINYENANEIAFDAVYKMQNFEEMFVNGVFTDKFVLANCQKENYFHGKYFGYQNITENQFYCLKFQGNAKLLQGVLVKTFGSKWDEVRSVLFLNAEIVLHDHWGNAEFWKARRSMRFAQHLVDIAKDFRLSKFDSIDSKDLVQRPENWQQEKSYRGAKGGEYLCAHLRRADFLYGREKTTPTLKSAASQIKSKLKEYNLEKVFIASDCSKFEFKNLKSYLGRARVYRFSVESLTQKNMIKDGGIAIVDQIICSHARFFIGTYESTFTYRIYEEREILGFPKETTFNSFCKNEDLSNCEKNSVWPIVY